MSSPEFKAGDRVQRKNSGRKGVALAPPDGAGDVPWTDDDGDHWIDNHTDLTLIPDTVTITVELPREEYEGVREYVGSSPDRAAAADPLHYPGDDLVTRFDRAARRFRKAVMESDQ